MWGSLRQKMGLPEGPVGPLKDRQLPDAPAKAVQVQDAGAPSGPKHPQAVAATDMWQLLGIALELTAIISFKCSLCGVAA